MQFLPTALPSLSLETLQKNRSGGSGLSSYQMQRSCVDDLGLNQFGVIE